jgi:ribulokinase
MSQDSYFIGIDMGTQGIRCAVTDQNGQFVSVNEHSYKIYFPEPGQATQKPSEWIESLDTALTGCLSELPESIKSKIAGLSVCATSSTVIAVDKDGRPLADAILWMDNRAKAEAEEINSGEYELLKYCGGDVSVEWLIPKTLWIKRNMPEVYGKSYKIVEQLDFINHYFTGLWAASVCQATCKGNYVGGSSEMEDQYFKQIGLEDYREKLNTNVLKLGEKVGVIKQEIAKKFGLPEDLIVYQGGIDAHVSMLGLGVCRPGDMGMIMGTSFVHLILSEVPVYKRSIWGPYRDAIIPGLYCIEGGQVSAGSITKWFLNEFNITGQDPYMLMAQYAKDVPIGSKGLITLDFFQGNRTPYKNPNAKGVFYGLTLNHNRADIYRSIMEGIAFGTRNIMDAIGGDDDVRINNIMACGGVTKNPLWLQIIADVTAKPITLTENSSNSGVLGCAVIAAVGSGKYSGYEKAVDAMVRYADVIKPDKEAHQLYEPHYQKYLSLYDKLEDMMDA